VDRPDVEAFFDDLQSRERKLAFSTAKGYQDQLRQFLKYLTDERYGWAATCRERFGAAPRQPLDEWNTIVGVSTYIGNPRRRPLTYDEVQALFDAATHGLVEEVRARGRKGGLAAQRNAALLKTVYAFGRRRREAEGLELQISWRSSWRLGARMTGEKPWYTTLFGTYMWSTSRNLPGRAREISPGRRSNAASRMDTRKCAGISTRCDLLSEPFPVVVEGER